ncbi:Branched-chain amino acid transport system / permease component [Microbacterium hydrocarbonoxydans]|jgi:simple sugar transport system permease protein|uniref:Branched-chain amino acid transport system / permease component n=1 Tax=Microbacterium hydrocarbonoxydans TaxID=273678 RepID=A0A0M2HXU3_9MICO|nr:ABC transporter permease [Microbacterium hydrocarbonoxydans]KJL49244.1 Branched-chain amino acid transport system / permease component [Microbacterium hydrocarbonoxydans]
MTAVTLDAEPRTVAVVSWKTPVIFTVVTVLFALLPLFVPRPGDSTFRLTAGGEILALPNVVVPGTATAWVAVFVAAAVTAIAWWLAATRRTVPLWLTAIFAAALIIGFLAWAAAGSKGTLPMIGLLSGALALATPLIFGALGGVIGERAGVVNIAIEAQLLAGAFTAAIVGSATGTPWAGLVAAMVAGVLVALVLGVFAITYHVDQVIVGVVLNVLVIGVTTFLFRQVLAPNQATLNTVTPFPKLPIPLLSEIPIIGPILFTQTIVVYLMYVVVFVVWYGMYRTRWGLRMRAVGEHPQAADTVGINVARTRYMNVLIAGAIAGMGGAFYTLVSVPRFNPEMTAGAGFIALAAVIFGKWDPIKATLAALLFGFATNLQGVLSVIGSPVPSQFMLMLPYVVTIFAVAGLVGRSRPPAADGEPYIKS